ncbi:MAG: hypothetical protein H6829_00050 [Planctomycetes bacterium]|nr:hypothetical protein [Planctomycetota bacterium]MCB9912456.1 hypothetical protein [Planctomycetota bacterium]HPF15384.1 hypothetical protein [Planctomycetota bacterium]
MSQPPTPHPFEAMRGVHLYPLAQRESLVTLADFCSVPDPLPGFGAFVDALPDIYAGTHFKQLIASVVAARRAGKPVVMAMGAHVLKVGLAPLVIDLMERGVVTHVALNSAGAIHDYEIATVGRTSERVDTQLPKGEFGFADETGRAIARAAKRGAHPHPGEEVGFGRALGRCLIEDQAPNVHLSVPAAAVRLGLGVTCHVSIGADIVHMHPACDGADLGAAALADFQHVCKIVSDLDGGVWINVGCAVILPEIFLKAVSVAINLGHNLDHMTTVNLDMIRQYRAETNVVRRPPGLGISLIGQHELLLPLFRMATLAKLAE